MSQQNFTRTNVDVATMEVSAPKRSSFDLSKRDKFTLPLGKFIPLRYAKAMPNTTLKGSVNAELALEKIFTPSAGPMRLDTHTFVVPARRVNNEYKKFQESALSSPMSLPSFTLGDVLKQLCYLYFKDYSEDEVSVFLKYLSDTNVIYDPMDVMREIVNYARVNIQDRSRDANNHYGYLQDWMAVETARLAEVYSTISSAGFTGDYFLGDALYDVFSALAGEGSILEHLGYDVFTYYSKMRERLNTLDSAFRTKHSPGVGQPWHDEDFEAYVAEFDFDWDVLPTVVYDDGSFTFLFQQPSQDELPLRAVYACWFDWMRNYHVEKKDDVLYPDNFTNSGIIANAAASIAGITQVVQLLIPHALNWSRDMFTMVQPDDVYRHVYAPASNDVGNADVLVNDFTDSPFDIDDYKSIQTALFGGGSAFSVTFPGAFFSSQQNRQEDTIEQFYHDLQVMRRANMLEKYLQKNYFNSDTFAGQIEARYGVLPSDYSLLVSQYVGGSESMINGEQHISSINTEDPSGNPLTDAGQRTLVANASCSGSFSYMCSDASYLINFASIVPIVSYDARSPFLHELNIMEQPIPEFAADNRIMIRTCDLVRDFNEFQGILLGFVPKYYQYRHAMDAAHGKFLREYRTYDWLRDRYSSDPVGQPLVGGIDNYMTTINAYSQHINIAPDCFLGLKPWDSIAYGKIELPLFIECPLPAKIEFI